MTTASAESRVSLQFIAETNESPELAPAPPKTPRHRTTFKQILCSRVAIACASLLIVTASVAGLAGLFRSSTSGVHQSAFFTVQPRTLDVTVTERGTLESQNNVEMICEVDDVQGDGIYGTQILWIIENGSWVEKGELVVELDTASHIERIDKQVIDTTYAQAEFIARTLDYENRKTQNETVQATAELAVETAKLRLKQYEDEQGGTFQIELQEIELDIQQREAQQLIDERNLVGTGLLHELGYKSKGDLAQAHLRALRAKSGLQRELARRRELVDYKYLSSKIQLEGALHSAERNLLQTQRNNEAALAQNRVWLKMAETGKFWNEKRLREFREQLGKCKIYAPQSGLVAYHVDSNGWGQSSTIGDGVAVRFRQPLLSIPDLTNMQVTTMVHESVVDRVRKGMRATVRVDAFSDRHYNGTIESVDVLPDPGGWLGADTKVYKTSVRIDEEVEGINPGMTAVVEIDVEKLRDVLCIPVQAIVQQGNETWCYVADRGRVVKRPLETGKTNDKFVEIRSGVTAGDRVVLQPSAILANTPRQEIAPNQEKSVASR